MLRIEQGGRARRETEQLRVEKIDVAKRPRRPNIVRRTILQSIAEEGY